MLAQLKQFIAALACAHVAEAVYYCNTYNCYNGWSCRTCYDYYYGYYCCDDYWYGSGWAIAVYVFLGLICISIIICCIMSASSSGAYYGRPVNDTMVVTTTKQAPVTGTAGYSQVVQGGEYTVQGAPVGGTVQGQPVGLVGENSETQPLNP